MGDKVPADLRLVDAKNLRTEEAALTGESVPANKSTDPVTTNATVGDRECMAFSGTMVVSGRATGVVVATGSATELGRINALLAGVSALETPLLRQIKKFGYAITAVIAVVGALVFAYGKWVKGMDFVELFQAVVGIAVSVIPEGLPAIITITLAIGVQRMAQRNAIIRRLPAVETLGSVSRICSDKTGTLTLMEMMVASAVTAESAYQVTGNGYAPEGQVKKDGKPADKDPVLELIGRVSMLCNDAELFEQDGVWKVEGDPTEGALYPFATKLGLDRQAEQAASPRIDAIPFESEHKFMATLHKSVDGKMLLFVKGAPEVILEHCDRQQTAGREAKPIDRAYFLSASDKLAGQGERVLALAWLENPGVKTGSLEPADLPKNLVLLGLIGLLDPPRKEAVEAVNECHGGGIRVTMITGDHRITAAAIAKMLDIGDGKTAITGAEIEVMNEAALQEKVRNVDVFARASPEHKLRLVKAIQANRQIVAMTGDGVNDAPALKKADIGVAMGIKGTEVTKEAAGMILADDNFASITAAVKEGRTVYNNIEKAILFMLPTNVAQALVIMVAIFLGFHHADHCAPGALGQHGDIGGAGPGHLVRAARARRDDPATARGGPADPDRLRDLARGLRRLGFARGHAMGILLDEVAGRLGSARPHGRGQHDHDRPGVLSPQQPLSARQLALLHGASRQQVPAARHRRGRGPAAAFYLRAAAAATIRHRGNPAAGLAVAFPGRTGVLPRGGRGETRHSVLRLVAQAVTAVEAGA